MGDREWVRSNWNKLPMVVSFHLGLKCCRFQYWLLTSVWNRKTFGFDFDILLLLFSNLEWHWFYRIFPKMKNVCDIIKSVHGLFWCDKVHDCLGTGVCVAIFDTCTYVRHGWQSFDESFWDFFFVARRLLVSIELLNKYDMNWCVLGTACMHASVRACIWIFHFVYNSIHACEMYTDCVVRYNRTVLCVTSLILH